MAFKNGGSREKGFICFRHSLSIPDCMESFLGNSRLVDRGLGVLVGGKVHVVPVKGDVLHLFRNIDGEDTEVFSFVGEDTDALPVFPVVGLEAGADSVDEGLIRGNTLRAVGGIIVVHGGDGQGLHILVEDTEGDYFIPTSALRQEGTSYHYLPPSREVKLDEKAVEAIERVMIKNSIPYRKCKTWTTDGFYRETKGMILFTRYCF